MQVRKGKKISKTVAEVFEACTSTSALELVDELFTTPNGRATIGVIRSVGGVCSLGIKTGKTWNVDRDGHLSRPLCRPAVDSISRALRVLDEEELEAGVLCRCPLGDRNVVFSVERPA